MVKKIIFIMALLSPVMLSMRLALFVSSALFVLSIVACAVFLSWMRRAA